MPQMGESIAEGTIVRWIKRVGDAIDKDEPLFEISTDKVDAEIPSPGAGVLIEIKVKEGETVPVNSVVAVIGAQGEKPAAAAVTAAPAGQAPKAAQPAPAVPVVPGVPVVPVVPVPVAPAGPQTVADLRRIKSSPLVRNIAKAHGVDISGLQGTGISGRVTKKDILSHIEGGAAARPAGSPGQAPMAPPAPAFKPGENVRIEKMGIMRKKIAEHMVLSAHTSPHVYSVYEVDFHRLAQLRDRKKAEYERNGAKLSFTALIAKATVDAIRAFPFTNASIDGDNIVYKKDLNLGIAVALDQGLIVPVIRNADEKNLLGLSRAIDDLAVRARAKKLTPDEVQWGTFTITNPGIFGAVYGLPLINQPQVAILGVGVIEKRVVVVQAADNGGPAGHDAIAIHPTCHISLGYDHRLIDGADAGRFLTYLKERLEQFDESWM
jgi:2-oxoglutarate dehydrogenase E2 component (dihydrolipoamide succinyltransferase)